MNRKLIYSATVAIAMLGAGSAIASEASQFDIGAGSLDRAEVRAELQRAIAADGWHGPSATHGDVNPAAAGLRSRAEVRSEALAEARTHRLASQYIGT